MRSIKWAEFFWLIMLLLSTLTMAGIVFAAPPAPPPQPVPLFGEEILIPTLVGYGLYRLRRKNKQSK